MPELPEVETTRSGIAPYLEGQTIVSVDIRCAKLRYPIPKTLSKVLSGQRVEGVRRRAKYLLIRLDSGTLLMHLGMSGSLRVITADIAAGKHDHIDITLSNGVRLRYTDPRKFGAFLWMTENVDAHPLLASLGPEPLSQAFNAAHLFHMAQRRKVDVKTLLMDNRVVVGVGNIYANEALFLASIDPRSNVNRLSREHCAKLVSVVKQVLRKAIKAGGTTLRDFVNSEGKPGYFQQMLYVYGRTGQPCLKCGSPIETYKTGQRSTFSCPGCQVRL